MQLPRPSLSLAYHEKSKLILGSEALEVPSDPALWPDARNNADIEYKSYPSVQKYEFKKNVQTRTCLLEDIIEKRRSARVFGKKSPITSDELGYILSYGLGREGDRRAPSGGAKYPLEYYLLISKCADIPRGVYHYDLRNFSLECIYLLDEQAISNLFIYEWAHSAGVALFMTALFARTTYTYGERGYRYILQESGHTGQNIYLAATACDRGVLAIGGAYDEEIERLLRVDGKSESLVYSFLIE